MMHSKIVIQQLRECLKDAYTRGYRGALDNIDQEIGEIISTLNIEEDFRIWSVKELSQLPEGTIFQHILLGRCWIVVMADCKKIQFKNGCLFSLHSNNDPWDKPMKLVFLP